VGPGLVPSCITGSAPHELHERINTINAIIAPRFFSLLARNESH